MGTASVDYLLTKNTLLIKKRFERNRLNEQKQCFQMAGIRKTGKIRMTQQDLLIKQLLQKTEKMADILYFLDEEKIAQEAQYDGLYAVCTDLF